TGTGTRTVQRLRRLGPGRRRPTDRTGWYGARSASGGTRRDEPTRTRGRRTVAPRPPGATGGGSTPRQRRTGGDPACERGQDPTRGRRRSRRTRRDAGGLLGGGLFRPDSHGRSQRAPRVPHGQRGHPYPPGDGPHHVTLSATHDTV